MAAIPRQTKTKNYYNQEIVYKSVKFPNPVKEAQKTSPTKPSDMIRAHQAKQNLLQSFAINKNMQNGIDMSNQRFFKPVTSKLTDSDNKLLDKLTDSDNKLLNKLTDSELRNLLTFTDDEQKNKEKVNKLVELFQDNFNPAIKYLLNVPAVQELLKKTGTQVDEMLDNKVSLVKAELEKDLSKLKPNTDSWKPLKIPKTEVLKWFIDYKPDDLPPFELCMDPEYITEGILGVFKELNSKSYFKLLPENAEYFTSIEVVNDNNERLEYPLEKEFIFMLVENKIVDNKELKENYLHIVNHTIGNKLGSVIDQFNSGKKVGFPIYDYEDEATIKAKKENNKIEAAEQLQNWANKSVKFKEWIAPLHGVNLVKNVNKFLKDVNEEPDLENSSVEGSENKPLVLVTPAHQYNLRSQSASKVKLSPEGKTLLKDYMKDKSKDKKTLKNEIKQMAADDPAAYGYLIEGKSLEIKTLIIPPNKTDRFERIKVILGALEADSTADYLEEYSAIVDALLSDKMITKDQHLFLAKKYFEIVNE